MEIAVLRLPDCTSSIVVGDDALGVPFTRCINAHLIHRETVPLPLKGKACPFLIVSAKDYLRKTGALDGDKEPSPVLSPFYTLKSISRHTIITNDHFKFQMRRKQFINFVFILFLIRYSIYIKFVYGDNIYSSHRI